ncbi:MAG TPA: alpha/beta hydrolase domain-containing protein, partial [Povalibacter sp.]
YLAYAAADLTAPASLATRERDADPAVTPSGLTWRYLDQWRIEVTKPREATPGALYEFVYRARDPVVYGLALASMRDLVSFLRYSAREDNPLRVQQRPAVRYVIGFGASQTGRTLKELVGEFNEDEAGRIVLDGANIVISGAGRNSVNSAFARPGLKDAQHTSWGLRGDEFPFSYPVTYDALSRRTDGVLAHCVASRTCPRIMHIDSENELWHGGTLTYVDTSGRDLAFPDNVRVFAFAGTEHSAAPRPGASPAFCAAPAPSAIEWASFARALFVALDRWIAAGEAPPASRYPSVARGELVPRSQYAFPAIPGIGYTGAFSTKYYVDFLQEPPARIAAYPALVPQVDADGLMRGGVRHPFLSAALATDTGWNVRREGFGASDLCMGTGMHVPFPIDGRERKAGKDPRKSIRERYASEADYAEAVAHVTQALVADRLLLPADAQAIIAEVPARYRAAVTR